MFLPLALWHPHNLILKNTLHLVLLSASFQKLKFLSLEANIMKNNCELCYTFSTSGMRKYYMQRDFSLWIFMGINIGVRLVLGFNVTFYWMRIREFFSEAVFFLLCIHSRWKKIQYYFYKWIYTEGDLHISVSFCTLLDIFITNHGCLYYWNPLRMESESCLKMLNRENVEIV